MAKKAELVEQARKLKLAIDSKSTIKELEAAIAAAQATDLPEKAIIKEEDTNDGNIQESNESNAEDGVVSEEVKTAKAGKRSAKALKEVEAEQAKEERKAQHNEVETSNKPKKQQKPPRTRLERKGKKFREAAKLIEKSKTYPLAEAIELAIKTSPTKFDATLELHVNLNVDPKQADQNVRGTVALPAGTGKSLRVAIFDDTKVEGADLSGIEALTKAFDKSELNFDILIATPSQMPKLGKYARLLGPKGLMPNPKSGTVTNDLAKAVKEAKAGRLEYRVDSTGIIHVGVGKVSFGKDKLLENIQAVAGSLKNNKPASVKGTYIGSVHLTTSMGPSITTLLE